MPAVVDAADFPILADTIDGNRITYLDSASTTLKPQCVIDAVVHFYAHVSANIHRGKHRLSEDASTAYEDARVRVAEFVGASTAEVVFVRNTTEALNVVCDGLELTADDVVVATFDSHHSNLLPWARRAKVEHLRVLPSGEPDLDHYAELLRERPRVVALNHCSNVTGVVAPLASMATMAKEHGAIVVADVAQSAPHQRLCLRDLDVDFAAFSAHKLLGPTGIGVLYGREPALRALAPAHVGGGTVDWVELDRFVYRELPHRFEAGTPHIAGAYGLHAALDYLDRIGLDRVAAHGAELGARMAAGVGQRPHLRPVCAPGAAQRTSIVSFGVDGVRNLEEVARTLSDSYGVMCRSGHLCAQPLVDSRVGAQVLRASAYVYNTVSDVDLFFHALDELCAPG